MFITCTEAQAREIQAQWAQEHPTRIQPEYSDAWCSGAYGMPRAVTALGLVTELDEYTRAHSERVAREAWTFGRFLGIRGRELQRLQYAALLHDLGKAAIKPEILNKPGRLTEDEKKSIDRHPQFGHDRLIGIKAVADLAPAVRHHHERFDGDGYPFGLAGHDIPEFARIIAILDAYDALISDRPYRQGCSPSYALSELAAQAGRQFDPRLVAQYVSMKATGYVYPDRTGSERIH